MRETNGGKTRRGVLNVSIFGGRKWVKTRKKEDEKREYKTSNNTNDTDRKRNKRQNKKSRDG